MDQNARGGSTRVIAAMDFVDVAALDDPGA